MKTISRLAKELRKAFKKSIDYRDAYADEFLNLSIATQIKVLREQRNWTQKELADKVGMEQPRISVMENVNYSSWSINTLRKLARAFNLTLRLSFESFGDRVKEIEKFSRKALERVSFDDDPEFIEEEEIDISTMPTAIAETRRNLARSNEPTTTDLAPKEKAPSAVRQIDLGRRQSYETTLH